MRNLIAQATTPEELKAAHDLFNEWRARQTEGNRWQVRTLGEVAEFFGLHAQTVKQWRTESPPMPGDEGRWDLQEIVLWRFQKLNNRRENPMRDSRDLVEIEKREAEVRALLRKEQQELGNLLPADVWQEFARELLSMIRSRIEDLPEIVADHVPADLRAFVYVPEDDGEASPLQRAVSKLVADVEEWLTSDQNAETET